MIKVFRERSFTRYAAQVIFLLLPTALLITFLLWNANHYFTFLQEQWKMQALYVAAGMGISFTLAQIRFRFAPLMALLLAGFYFIYQILDRFAVGEFDSFFISVQFLTFAWLFTTGWLIGWCLQRVRFFPVILSGILLVLSIFLISKTGLITIEKLLSYFTPVALYSIYLIYTAAALRSAEKTDFRFWFRFTGRLIAFLLFLGLSFGTVIYLLYPEIKERVEEYGGQGKEGENQMLQNKKDGTVQNRDRMGLSGNNNRNKNPEPLFCAHIENNFPGTDLPNPLYLTSYHFTRFDTLTETFERDTAFAYNDEFLPDPSRIPLFFTYTDSTRLQREMASRNKTTVEVEIYKKRLAAQFYVAPSTAYFVQPITVEKDFQKEFTSAYRSKSSVSDLNSAYFIYNSEDPQIRQFQQQRFEVLRKAKIYSTVDPAFFRYYTFFPTGGQYRPVKELADSLAKGKSTTIDKVLSVRDYFLQRNALGKRVFEYADNPGVPGLPGASKLLYFLFESKKGYCAYYAAATVAILRSMDIPCRVVTGFLTVDRSDKNKGWYWYYEDQSHGWVQVYFPEYGWIDFDTTVGNEEAEQSPTPDGTPPMQPPKALLAVSGKINTVDTLKKIAALQVSNMLFKDVEYKDIKLNLELDLRVARIWKDSIQMPLGILKKGDDVMAVSYAEKLKAYSPEKTADQLVAKFPKLVPTDEVYIRDFAKEKKAQQPEEAKTSNTLRATLWILGGIVLLLLSALLLIPSLVYRWYKWKMNHANSLTARTYYTYRASTLLLHMLGVRRGNETLWKFAQRRVDPRFTTQLSDFMAIYLKQKYAHKPLSPAEESRVVEFFASFERQIQSAFTVKQRLRGFMNINTFVQYYGLPEPDAEAESIN